MKKIIILTILFNVLFANGMNADRKYKGNAFDLKSKKSLYTENHFETYNGKLNEKITYYISMNGDTLAKREMNFLNDLTRPKFQLEDFRSGYTEGAEVVNNNKVKVFTRENRNKKLESKILDIPGEFVIDGGLTFFFRENWERLINSEKIDFYFIAPAKLDYFKFRVYSIGQLKYAGIDAMKIRLEISSWILRQFVDPIEIIYSMDNQEILYYEGISNINDNNGKSLNVIIDYKNNIKVN